VRCLNLVQMSALIQSGLDILPCITHRFPARDFQDGFELMKSGNQAKSFLIGDGMRRVLRCGQIIPNSPPLRPGPRFETIRPMWR